MNKHTKLALLIAPILAIVGYIALDIYLEYQAKQPQVFQLTVEKNCNIRAKKCVLSSGEFKVSIYSEKGMLNDIIINSTAPLNNATLFLVDKSQQAIAYSLKQKGNRYYWQLPQTIQLHSPQTLRLITTVKGGQYIAEFISQ